VCWYWVEVLVRVWGAALLVLVAFDRLVGWLVGWLRCAKLMMNGLFSVLFCSVLFCSVSGDEMG
jgi:hypothetical protein